MKDICRFVCGLSLVAFLLVATAAFAQRFSVTVKSTAAPPSIDAVLNDACWKEAAQIADFRLLGSDEKPAAATALWLAHDQEWLYLGVKCEDEPGKTIVAERTGRLTGYPTDDLIEIFIGPSSEQYYHFVLTAGNAKYEQKVSGDRRDLGWDIPWPSATKIEKGGWIAELAIPLYLLGPGKLPGQPLVFNLTRNKRTEPPQPITWAPVAKGFHDPERFGSLTGLENHPVSLVFAPIINEATVQRYLLKGGKYAYLISAKVSNYGGDSGKVQVVVEDQPAGQPFRRLMQVISVAALQDRVGVPIEVPVPLPGERSAKIWIAKEGAPFGDAIAVEGMANLNPLRIYLDRNYYTTETQARLFCQTIFSKENLKGFRLDLVAKDAKGKVLKKESRRCTQGMDFTILLPRLTPGEYSVEVSLVSPERRVIAQQRETLTKHPPAPAGITELKIDQEKERLLLNGKPWFPVGFIMYGGMGEGVAQKLAESGFDTMVRWWVVGGRNLSHLPKAVEDLEAAQRYGLYVFESSTGYSEGSLLYSNPDLTKNLAKSVENLPKVIPTLSKHPAVVGYFGLDEPGKDLLHLAKTTYDTVRKLDPYHLQISGGPGVWPDEGFEVFDFLGVAKYFDPARATRNSLALLTHGMRQAARRHRRPFFAVPQSADRSSYGGAELRPQSPQETRNNAYLSVIQGAKGIIYFAYYGGHHPTAWKAMSLTAQEIRTLSPILLEPDPPQNVQVTVTAKKTPPTLPAAPGPNLSAFIPRGSSWRDMELPVVQALVKNRPEGGEVILAANSWKNPLEVTFAISSLGPNAQVKEFFTGKEYRVKEGRFEDHFEPSAVRVYVIEGSIRKPAEPVRVGVNVVKHAEEAEPAERRGPNLVQNPGFEEEGGWNLGPAKIVDDIARSGRRSLRVDAPADAGHADAGASVQLQPRTKYRLSFWVKTDIRKGAQPPNFYFAGIAGFTLPMVQPEWKEFSTICRTGDEPRKLPIVPRVYQGEGSVWIDDASVEPIEEPKRRNCLINSSFEEATLPGWPDTWNPFRPDRLRQDDSTAYHGRFSLRVEWPSDQPYSRVNAANIFPFQNREPGRPYTLSVYLKAERDNFPVELSLFNRSGGRVAQEVKVGTEWQRYVVPLTIPKEQWNPHRWWHMTEAAYLGIRLLGKGVVWADAVQFEEGTEATAYEPDDYRAPKLDEKWLK